MAITTFSVAAKGSRALLDGRIDDFPRGRKFSSRDSLKALGQLAQARKQIGTLEWKSRLKAKHGMTGPVASAAMSGLRQRGLVIRHN